MKTIAQQLNVKDFPFEIKDKKGKFYCWAVIEYGSDECRCKKQCKACAMNDKQ